MKSKSYKHLDKIDNPKDLRALKPSELNMLAAEIRQYLLEIISKTGGHLAAGLGTVELTIALHYIFNTPEDKLIWDVGHQCYPHKIITGRRENLKNIRQYGGISGFLKSSESEYDVFGAGHSSTSISAAVGMCVANNLKRKDNNIVAIIGDGGMTAGMAYEALCHAGDMKADMLVVLNDNDMSISPNVGALNKYLTKILSGETYTTLKSRGKEILGEDNPLKKLVKKIKDNTQSMFLPGHLFEEIGFKYYGPIDGHDIDSLTSVLRNLKEKSGPKLLHVVTTKGKGYKIAENNPVLYHGVTPFDIKTGENKKTQIKNTITYTKVFSKWINYTAQNNEDLVAITPAMREGSGLVEFEENYPNRFFDVGIAEQHAVTLAGGMAKGGLKPIVAIYSTFLQRGYDQLVHDINLQDLNVLFAIDRAGLVGADGETHHGIYDIAFMRILPGIIIMAPSDENELWQMLNTGFHHNGPASVRYPRGNTLGKEIIVTDQSIQIGKSKMILSGNDIAILAFGPLLNNVFDISKQLSLTLVDMRFIKPLDKSMISEISKTHKKIITIEDGVIQGGAGSYVNEFLQSEQLDISVINIGVPDKTVSHGSQDSLYKEIGLDKKSLELKINEIYNHFCKNEKIVN